MKMEDAHTLAQPCPGASDVSPRSPDTAPAPRGGEQLSWERPGDSCSSEVYQTIGHMTRLLHDTLEQLGVMPHLQSAADNLPDARSRLTYIARKTGDAAERVLNSVDRAKAEHEQIARAARAVAQAVVADPAQAVSSGAVMGFVGEVEEATARIDRHLTDIMLAQDFHDLTGQVVAKVVKLAGELEDTLVKLLIQVAPPGQVKSIDPDTLHGPVVDPAHRADVVTNQGEVDDLLASLGF